MYSIMEPTLLLLIIYHQRWVPDLLTAWLLQCYAAQILCDVLWKLHGRSRHQCQPADPHCPSLPSLPSPPYRPLTWQQLHREDQSHSRQPASQSRTLHRVSETVAAMHQRLNESIIWSINQSINQSSKINESIKKWMNETMNKSQRNEWTNQRNERMKWVNEWTN